jgi:3',5'-cyclic AMP phosphodiesterase CpdA
VPARILHVSDLHVGKHGAPEVDRALGALTESLKPDLVVATGDLTHRGRRDQHEGAATVLRRLGPPVVAVPGNHDIPHTFPARVSRPWAEFDRLWETTAPVFGSDELCVVGLNSVRPWRHQSGRLRAAQLGRAAAVFADAPASALRVALLHHQLTGAPWRTRKRPVARRDRVLGALVDAGAELILSGHIHQGAVSERHEFEAWAGGARGAVVAVAPGLGQPRPRRRGEARGVLLHESDAAEIRTHTYVWRTDAWVLTAVRRFARGAKPLLEQPIA